MRPRLSTRATVSARLLAAVAVLILVSAGFALAGASARTQSLKYTPFGSDGYLKSSLNKRTTDGECWTSSLAAGRDDAWRCMHGDFIEDPCFEHSSLYDVVVCPGSPWRRTVLVLNAALDYNDRFEWHSSQPWAIRLRSG